MARKARVSVSLDPDQLEVIRRFAQLQGVSPGAAIAELLRWVRDPQIRFGLAGLEGQAMANYRRALASSRVISSSDVSQAKP